MGKMEVKNNFENRGKIIPSTSPSSPEAVNLPKMLLDFASICSFSSFSIRCHKIVTSQHNLALIFPKQLRISKGNYELEDGFKDTEVEGPISHWKTETKESKEEELYDDSEDEAEGPKGKPYIKHDEDAPPRGTASRHHIEVIYDSNHG